MTGVPRTKNAHVRSRVCLSVCLSVCVRVYAHARVRASREIGTIRVRTQVNAKNARRRRNSFSRDRAIVLARIPVVRFGRSWRDKRANEPRSLFTGHDNASVSIEGDVPLDSTAERRAFVND